MKINGKLEWTDYLQAHHLNMDGWGWARRMIVILLGVLLIGVGILIFVGVRYGDVPGMFVSVWPALVVLIVAGLYYGLWYQLWLPRQVRKIFNQHKEMPLPFEHEITATALRSSNQYGYSERPWGNFHKWKENKTLFMIYTSDVQFVLIPKRFMTAEQTATLRERLVENHVRRQGKPFRS